MLEYIINNKAGISVKKIFEEDEFSELLKTFYSKSRQLYNKSVIIIISILVFIVIIGLIISLIKVTKSKTRKNGKGGLEKRIFEGKL